MYVPYFSVRVHAVDNTDGAVGRSVYWSADIRSRDHRSEKESGYSAYRKPAISKQKTALIRKEK